MVLDSNPDLYDDDCEEKNEVEDFKESLEFMEFKKKATLIVEEYFTTDDITSAAHELSDLGQPSYHYYFVKKLVSIAMDRHDKEREMASILLSTLYSEVIDPSQVYRGFCKLLEAADDLSLDIPETVDILALFIARAIIDDILPPAFLKEELSFIPEGSKGAEVIQRAEKGYLSVPLRTEIILRRWGGCKSNTVDVVKARITNLLLEYVSSGDKEEAFRCIKDLKVPFFHHEIVKRTLILAMERRAAEDSLLDFLKGATERGVINASHVSEGFDRLMEVIDDLILDIPSARNLLQAFISKAASDGWLSASSLRSLYHQPKDVAEDDKAKVFKAKATLFIQEYFFTGDILEVMRCLMAENPSSSVGLNAIFIKKLVTLAMERKNREKEMASVLMTYLCFPSDDIVCGFLLLFESAEDTALDVPAIVEDLAMFLARAVVDEVLAPSQLEEIESHCEGSDSICGRVIQLSRSLLNARLSAERVLRCWGGGGGCKIGRELDDVKESISKLLEEYDSGGDLHEACRCIKDLGMSFFHHEVVKKSLVTIMERRNERLWGLLQECYLIGLITTHQMTKGFERVADCLHDLVLDIPDAETQFEYYNKRAKLEGWLDSSLPACNNRHSGCSENA